MFKRANKITALVVAAASIMSVVPAMAADSTRLGTKSGSIREAYAYDGKYIYEGYKGDTDRAIYSNESGTEKQIEDLDNVAFSGADVDKYGDKYVSVVDGTDEYVIDLSTSKVYDDDDSKLASSIADSAARKVRNKLKNTDRYSVNWNVDSENDSFSTLFNNQFADVWYQFTTTSNTDITTPQAVVFNTTGQYVDVTHDLNLKLYNADKKLVSVESYGTRKDGILVTLNAAPKVIAQDKDYLYLLADVTVDGAVNIHDEDLIPLTTLTLVQKVSKTQGEKEGKAYLPKSTESYLYLAPGAPADNDFNIDDDNEAGDALTAAKAGTEVRAIDGVLYVYTKVIADDTDFAVLNEDTASIGKVRVTTVKLNNHAKTEALSESTASGRHVKYDLYSAVGGDDVNTDADGYSVDVDGNLWIAHDGEIKKSAKAGDFTTVYEVDSSIDKLDVYNEGNLVAWGSDSDRYTTVSEGKKQTTDDAIVVDPNLNADKFKTGFDAATKKYYKDGALVTNAWVSDAGKWYFVDENSTAKTGWYQNAQGTWYMLGADGAMLTGWFQEGGNWYYLEPVNTSGAMKTGWFQDYTGTWYYAEGSGKMLSNQYVGQYWLSGSGAWVK